MEEKRGEQKTLATITLICVLAISAISAFSVKAWVYPDSSEDNRLELYEPHISGIHNCIRVKRLNGMRWTIMS